MLMLDLDHFKAINDRRGHAVGARDIAEICAAGAEALPQRADDALYRAKAVGRNRVEAAAA